MKQATLALASLLALASISAGAEQEKETPTRRPTTALRIVVTIARYDGEKKIGGLPYTIHTTTNNLVGFKLRMGVEVAVPVTTVASNDQAKGSGTSPQPTFQYRNVGTNIDCLADSLDDGRFSVTLNVEQSSIQTASEARPGQGSDRPMFRTFNARVPLVLRDGQSTQYVAATDPVTGESVRLDVALTVLK